MNNLQKFLCNLPFEAVWMYFFSNGCEVCPAKDFCDAQPEGTCCRENFSGWGNMGSEN